MAREFALQEASESIGSDGHFFTLNITKLTFLCCSVTVQCYCLICYYWIVLDCLEYIVVNDTDEQKHTNSTECEEKIPAQVFGKYALDTLYLALLSLTQVTKYARICLVRHQDNVNTDEAMILPLYKAWRKQTM